MNLIEARRLCVRLGKRQVLNGVDLFLKPGEFLGVIGPNGAGKSTLLKTLIRIVPFVSGEVMILGKNLKRLKPAEQARMVAYMPQETVAEWDLRVSSVVRLGRIPHLTLWQEPGPEDKKAVLEAMRDTDVLGLQHRGLKELAGGEKRLVMLARAMAVRPSVLLADEPVGGLDPRHQLQVMELLKRFARDCGNGIIAVLHDLTLAARFCDRLVLLHEGTVLAGGTPGEVLTPFFLREGYGIEAECGQINGRLFVLPWRCEPPLSSD